MNLIEKLNSVVIPLAARSCAGRYCDYGSDCTDCGNCDETLTGEAAGAFDAMHLVEIASAISSALATPTHRTRGRH